MKVFISHCWMNKDTAQVIADALKNDAEVWLDIQHLKAGDAIQPIIDKDMESMDVVLVLWSKAAAGSAGVDAEIRTAVRLKKKVLPVLLKEPAIKPGEPELAAHPLLKGVYGINFD